MKIGSLIALGVGGVVAYYGYSNMQSWINKPPKFIINKLLIRRKWFCGADIFKTWQSCESMNVTGENADSLTYDYPKGLNVVSDRLYYWMESALNPLAPDYEIRDEAIRQFLSLNKEETKYVLNYFEQKLGANLLTLIDGEYTLDQTLKTPAIQKITSLYSGRKMLKQGAIVGGSIALIYGGYKFSQKQGWVK